MRPSLTMTPTHYCKCVICKAEMKTGNSAVGIKKGKTLPALFLASFLLLAVPAP